MSNQAIANGLNPHFEGNFEGESDQLRDLRLQLARELDDSKSEKEWLFEQLNGPVVESPVRVLGGWLADELDEDRWAHVEPLLNAAAHALAAAHTELREIAEALAKAEVERDRLLALIKAIMPHRHGLPAEIANGILRDALGAGDD